MAREGMDVDIVTSNGNQMRDIGDNGIPAVLNAVEGIISQIQTAWHGDDANQFIDVWHSTFKPNLTSIATEVSAHGQLAVTNAQAQQAASAAAGGGTA